MKKPVSLLFAAILALISLCAHAASWRTLRRGEESPDVYHMQRALAHLSYAVKADGKFGDGTEKAVIRFQQDHHLNADGAAGSATLGLLYSLAPQFSPESAERVKPFFKTPAPDSSDAFPPTAGPMVTDAPSTHSYASTTLYLNSRGPLVLSVRCALKQKGYSVDTNSDVYDMLLQARVAEFQKDNGLTVDGLAGKATQKLLFSGNAAPSVTNTPAAPLPTAAPNSPLTSRAFAKTPDGKSLNVRRRARAGNNILLTIPSGTEVSVLSASGAWCRIFVNGTEGYVQKRFLSFSSPAETAAPTLPPVTEAPVETPAPNPGARVGTATVNTRNGRSLNLRSSDQTGDNIIGQLRQGTVVSLIRQGKSWCMIAHAGQTGYVMTKYLRFDPAPSAPPSGPIQPLPSVSPEEIQRPSSIVTLRIDSRDGKGDAVTLLQKRLKQLGFSVSVSGTYDIATHEAIVSFQVQNGLTPSGIADVATQQTLYAKDAKANSGHSGGNGASTDAKTGAGSVKLLHWYKQIKPTIRSGQYINVYHPASGASFTLRLYSLGRHADCEPKTLGDTEAMNKAFGRPSWNIRTVYVQLPNGVWTLAAMHNRPHLYGSIKNNGFGGHLCVHFLRDMEEAQKSDPSYGVQNQEMIRKAWKQMTGETIQ